MSIGLSAGPEGVTLPGTTTGSFDVYFDDQHVWSFSRTGRRPQMVTVPWPRAMQRWLEGTTQVELRQGGKTVLSQELAFGTAPGRISMIDDDGVPIMIDKWGLIQRPFSGRGEGVVEQLVDITEKTLRVLADDCGIHAWLAFGSLLGAAREGGVIAHDSDVDVAYLSHARTPAEVNREVYGITRALRAAGLRVVNKSGGFVTVMFKAPDGAPGSLDVYSCFYVDGLLHATATVRSAVPAAWIEPLGTTTFEGRELPAPADVDRMLTVSYGAGWRVPDPSFQHRPGKVVADRFHDWQGDLMYFRRAWERVHREAPESVVEHPTDFGRWAAARLPAGTGHVVDLGCGAGADVLALARRGVPAVGLDFARGAFQSARRVLKEEDLPATFLPSNVADRRDALSAAALLLRTTRGPRVLTSSGCSMPYAVSTATTSGPCCGCCCAPGARRCSSSPTTSTTGRGTPRSAVGARRCRSPRSSTASRSTAVWSPRWRHTVPTTAGC